LTSTSGGCLPFCGWICTIAVLAFACFQASVLSAEISSSSYEEELIHIARQRKLSELPQWRALLFMKNSAYHDHQSLVEVPSFFFSKTGMDDPSSELDATLRAFFQPVTNVDDNKKHPQCRFPARFKWLSKELNFNLQKMPHASCKDFLQSFEVLNAGKVSIIFSSFFMNNPSSMFGHTFLRLQRKPSAERVNDSALLDHAVNYSAWVPPGENDIVFAMKGLVGGYPGQFSIGPYYHKVQEYNNFESRDLWEYELNLTQDEVDLILMSLWEISQYPIPYYYFDSNCSFMILKLLDVARPDILFSKGFFKWVIPSETLKAVTKQPGMVRKVEFRSSSLYRFEYRKSQLNERLQDKLQIVIKPDESANLGQAMSSLSPVDQVKVLDAALEYVEFDEDLGGDKSPQKYKTLRPVLLKQRAQIALPSETIPSKGEDQRPDLGHAAARYSLEGGLQLDHGAFSELTWRPALHDIGSFDVGYAPGMQIEFFHLGARYDFKTKRGYVSQYDLIEIKSLTPLQRFIKKPSWTFGLHYEAQPFCREENVELCQETHMKVGGGFTLGVGKNIFYLLGIAEMGVTNIHKEYAYVAPGAQLGTSIRFGQHMKFLMEANGYRRFAHIQKDVLKFNAQWVLFPDALWEYRLKVSSYDQAKEVSLILSRFQ